MLNPEDLGKEVDISGRQLFELTDSYTRCRDPYVVTCKELIDMLDKLNRYEEQITEAKKDLTKVLNDFLERP